MLKTAQLPVRFLLSFVLEDRCVVAICATCLLLFVSTPAAAGIDLRAAFGSRDACFVLQDIKTGKRVEEHNADRCRQRFSPCSSFKIAAALMAFESGVLKDENQVIKWDGKKREIAEHNQDLTPITWMKYSAMWVTQWITPQLGMTAIKKYLHDFSYGNEDFSSGLTESWQTSSLKISAYEQVAFLSNLWNEKLPLSPRTFALTKKIVFVKDLGDRVSIYGKTGTGCVSGHECLTKPDKMLGWFVGIAKTKAGEYAFAANATDTEPEKDAAGPRLRKDILGIIEKLNLP
jgi:beta-lactamase class D